MNLTLLQGYNNYFDRIIKKEKTLEDYYKKSKNYENKENINFVPNDGIISEQVVNWMESWTPDYLVVSNDYGEIVSRWFVIDAIRTRGRQYKLSLKRDVIADNIDNIKNSPIYVEKGMLSSDNPLIYNDERMQFNEIKKDELLLKDRSNCAWLVGYYTKKHQEKTFSYTNNILAQNFILYEDLPKEQKDLIDFYEQGGCLYNKSNIQLTLSLGSHISITSPYGDRFESMAVEFDIKQNELSKYKRIINKLQNSYCYNADAKFYVGQNPQIAYSIADENFNKYLLESQNFKKFIYIPFADEDIVTIPDRHLIDEVYYDSFGQNIQFITQDMINTLKKLDGKVIKKNDKTYLLKYKETYKDIDSTFNTSSTFYEHMMNVIGEEKRVGGKIIGSYKFVTKQYVLDILTSTDASKNVYNVSFDKGNEHLSSDTIYDIFYLPYTDNLYAFDNRELKYMKVPLYNKSVALGIASSIISEAGGTGSGSTLCYDVQLLPYCPDPNLINFDPYRSNETNLYLSNKIPYNTIDNLDDTAEYSNIKTTENITIGFIFWAIKSKMEINLFPQIPEWLKKKNNNVEKKIQVSCDFVRLCSPNYSGLFDFNVAKNDGVSYFNCDMVFKPFNPYIHINPNFGGLYNKDFNDSRGLICGGDYSIGSTTDAWTQYELNNKNYQQMFDREIEHMDKIHSYDLASNIMSSMLGAGSTGIGAQGAASIAGLAGPVGLIAGGASAVAGAVDIGMGEGKYNEGKSFKTDMFNMSLQNIKAQPTSLSKISAITNNNKIWPFVEYYSCTDKEKDAFREKIKYNGMTVMVIDKLSNYINAESKQYFKGQLIRCEELNDDTHMKSTIYEELNKGVYI